MATKITSVPFFLFFFLPLLISAQPSKLSPEKQELLLQLSLNYYTVVKEGQVDQDSSLLLVSSKDKLSRCAVIADGFENQLSLADRKWIDTRQTGAAVNGLTTLHGIAHIKQLVLLGAYYAFQPGYRQKDRDSAQYFLYKAQQESTAIHSTFWIKQILCLLGKNYYKANQVKQGTDCFTDLIKRSQKSRDKLMEAKAWDFQGTYIPPAAATIMLKINSIKKANALYQQVNQPAKQINTLMNMAYLGFLLKDIDGAEASALKALHLENAMNFPYLHYTFDILSLISASKGSLDKDLDYELKAVKTCLATKDSLGIAYFYARVGHVKYGQKATTYPFSNYWLKKSVEEFNKSRDPDIYRSLFNLADNLCETGKAAEAISLLQKTLKNIEPVNLRDKTMVYLSLASNWESLKNYRLSEKYYLMADQLTKHDSLVTKEMRDSYTKYRIGKFYFGTKNYNRAEIYLRDFLTIGSRNNDDMTMSAEAHMFLYKIDSARGNYESAARHLQQYVHFYNTLVNANDAKSIAGMKLQFLMTQKEKDFQLLQAKSALQNQQANTIRKLIYIGLTVAILIIGLLYNRYYMKNKQKSEIDKKNRQLQSVISEKDELLLSKEWLLKEVHHRVKNNLHTVICLLESQAAYLENDALKAVESSQHRIYAMSLIHQKLYHSDDIQTVDMSVYLPEFVSYLNESFGTSQKIRFALNVEAIKLGVSYAVPLSLIINEAVTNSIKYAFPSIPKGLISIKLEQVGEDIALVIADNGIGIDLAQISTASPTLGLKLLRGLSEDIKADFHIENKQGTVITVTFETDELMDSLKTG